MIGNITNEYQREYNAKHAHYEHIQQIADMTQRICETYEKHIYENVDRAMKEFFRDLKLDVNISVLTYLNGKPIANQQELTNAVLKIIMENLI